VVAVPDVKALVLTKPSPPLLPWKGQREQAEAVETLILDTPSQPEAQTGAPLMPAPPDRGNSSDRGDVGGTLLLSSKGREQKPRGWALGTRDERPPPRPAPSFVPPTVVFEEPQLVSDATRERMVGGGAMVQPHPAASIAIRHTSDDEQYRPSKGWQARPHHLALVSRQCTGVGWSRVARVAAASIALVGLWLL
jgi:hypothetical protein